MELDTWNRFAFAKALLVELTAAQVDLGNFLRIASLFITEHLEIVLENIDKLIWLERLFNAVRGAVDELIHFGVHIARLLSDLIDEVLMVVLAAVVHWAIEVCLGREVEHLLRRLETNLKYSVVGFALNVARGFLGEFQIHSTFSGLLFNHLVVLKAELSAGFWNFELYQLSIRVTLI